jgi:hypothetical protein
MEVCSPTYIVTWVAQRVLRAALWGKANTNENLERENLGSSALAWCKVIVPEWPGPGCHGRLWISTLGPVPALVPRGPELGWKDALQRQLRAGIFWCFWANFAEDTGFPLDSILQVNLNITSVNETCRKVLIWRTGGSNAKKRVRRGQPYLPGWKIKLACQSEIAHGLWKLYCHCFHETWFLEEMFSVQKKTSLLSPTPSLKARKRDGPERCVLSRVLS